MMNKMVCTLICTLLAGSTASAIAESAVPPNAGIARICISVTDLSTTRSFFTELMELKVAAEGELDRETVQNLYHMDATAKYVMLKNDLQTTMIELLEFDPKPVRTSREGYHCYDYGYYDIAFRCQDNNEAYAKFTDLGYAFSCPPYRYVTSWSNAEVLEAVLIGPDNIPIALMGKTASTPAFEGMFRNMPDSVLIVEHIAEADRYYVDTLGMSKVFDMVLEDGLVEPIFNLESGAQVHMTMYMGSDANTPVVEIISFEKLKGVSMTAEGASVPANAGTFATCFEVEDLDAALALHEANGFSATSDIVEMELAPIGRIRAVMVSGPSQAMMELYEVIE